MGSIACNELSSVHLIDMHIESKSAQFPHVGIGLISSWSEFSSEYGVSTSFTCLGNPARQGDETDLDLQCMLSVVGIRFNGTR